MSGPDNHSPRLVLASRKNGGLRVTLLWAADTNTIAVRVRDDITDEQFELLVEPDANPIDVYEHPLRARRLASRRPSDRGSAAGGLKATEATHDMDGMTLATEAARYLEAIDLFRSLNLNVEWRSEADEVGALSLPAELPRPRRCRRCAGPLVRINGQHVCFRT